MTISGGLVTSLAALECLVRVDGLLEVTDTEVLDLELPALEEVGGDLVIYDNYPLGGVELLALRSVAGSLEVAQQPWLDELRMPELSEVGGDLLLNQLPFLPSIRLPRLSSVGGDLWLRYLDTVLHIELDALESVGADLWLSGNSLLQEVSWSELLSVDRELMVTSNPMLVSLQLSSLTGLGALRLSSNASLSTLGLPQLQDIQGLPGSLRLSSCALLEVLALPALQSIGDFLMVASNSSLSQFQLQSLGFVGGDFHILDNNSLATSAAETLRDDVGASNIGGQVVISGNGG